MRSRLLTAGLLCTIGWLAYRTLRRRSALPYTQDPPPYGDGGRVPVIHFETIH